MGQAVIAASAIQAMGKSGPPGPEFSWVDIFGRAPYRVVISPRWFGMLSPLVIELRTCSPKSLPRSIRPAIGQGGT
jgi:hypothetical protein